LPFGSGPRVCIGASFATIEAAVILGVLVRTFRFLPVAGHHPKPVARVTLRPRGGMPLLIARRDRTSAISDFSVAHAAPGFRVAGGEQEVEKVRLGHRNNACAPASRLLRRLAGE
jgi:hypothetical protein